MILHLSRRRESPTAIPTTLLHSSWALTSPVGSKYILLSSLLWRYTADDKASLLGSAKDEDIIIESYHRQPFKELKVASSQKELWRSSRLSQGSMKTSWSPGLNLALTMAKMVETEPCTTGKVTHPGRSSDCHANLNCSLWLVARRCCIMNFVGKASTEATLICWSSWSGRAASTPPFPPNSTLGSDTSTPILGTSTSNDVDEPGFELLWRPYSVELLFSMGAPNELTTDEVHKLVELIVSKAIRCRLNLECDVPGTPTLRSAVRRFEGAASDNLFSLSSLLLRKDTVFIRVDLYGHLYAKCPSSPQL
ncbi:hypothetical protein FOZ62_003383 [Perkinsus olseni]|uniref:Uncharacterized protein n=1 Tax=Perkinsus olseni TaxID=32597 RepID=A0A7J6S4R9_PEROL|nr:hypothetical protein FOZ62_003383 [Perkinsus olseni]